MVTTCAGGVTSAREKEVQPYTGKCVTSTEVRLTGRQHEVGGWDGGTTI